MLIIITSRPIGLCFDSDVNIQQILKYTIHRKYEIVIIH